MARPSWFPVSTVWAPEAPGFLPPPVHLGQGLGLLEVGTDVGEPDRLVPAVLEGLAALGVFGDEYAGLLATEKAGPAKITGGKSLGQRFASPDG